MRCRGELFRLSGVLPESCGRRGSARKPCSHAIRASTLAAQAVLHGTGHVGVSQWSGARTDQPRARERKTRSVDAPRSSASCIRETDPSDAKSTHRHDSDLVLVALWLEPAQFTSVGAASAVE